MPRGFLATGLPEALHSPQYPQGFSIYCHSFGTSEEGFLSANGLPRGYHGQYLSFAGQTLVEVNPNILVRDVERMYISVKSSFFYLIYLKEDLEGKPPSR